MAVIPKNSREEYRIERQDFKGTDLVQIRVWFDPGDGDMRPSKKGVAFRAELVPDIVAALGSALEAEVEQ